ncbi:MAG: thiamine pyrophosphate-binding protein, partial [Burkholderiales bacterium]
QERDYPARVHGSELQNPDFVRLAEAYGCHAERVTTTDAFEAALVRALDADRPALIEIMLDPQALTVSQTLDEIRAAALARQRERG